MSNEHKLDKPLERNLFFGKQVTQETIQKLTEEIVEINENDAYLRKYYKLHGIYYKARPINIYIDSYGGYVYQCFGLLSIMDNSKTAIHTIVTGAAMSCGFLIGMHGHKRYAYKHSTHMYHQVGAGTTDKAKEMEEYIVEVVRLQKVIEKITVEHTNIPAAKLRKNYKRKKDWYMTAKQALKYGVIDEIISVKKH